MLHEENPVILLIDAGNSRLKWTIFEDEAMAPSQAVSYPPDLHAWLDAHWQTGFTTPRRVLVSNVAGPVFAEQLTAWTRQHWELTPEFITAEARGFQITNAYSAPQRLGSDRWAALIAARRGARGAVCVINSGTALTLDVLTANGQHQGGLIIPGLALMREALTLRTHGITEQDLLPSPATVTPTLLGRDTASGVQGGTLYAQVAVIERVVHDVTQEIGASLTCIITGGGAPCVLPLLHGTYQHRPDLVLRGLAIIAQR